MWLSVMTIFIAYAAIFILFEDYDRKFIMPFNEVSDWHLLLFSLVVMGGLGFMLYRYAKRMDERISREQAEKENRMRRELTQNIAHELKTPVASILGYTDTILDSADMPEETRLRFIERTNAQARRLTALLQDISTLNRMDYAKDLITMERVDVAVLFADIVQETAIAMQARQMSMRNYLPQSIIIHGNYSLLYSIFRNLVDNAISYAGQGTTVEVWAEQQPDCWFFCLSFYLLYFSYLLWKTVGCFSGCLMSSASIQKLFCGIYSAFKCSFDEFVGEKVFSPSYSSAILVPPPKHLFSQSQHFTKFVNQ